jgi:cystathionine beta-lyase
MGRRSGGAESERRGVSDSEQQPDTQLVTAGRKREWTWPLVNPAVHRASTILFDSVAEMRAVGLGAHGVYQYGRNGTPTQWALAEALTAMEPGAAATKLFPSGVAAVAVALMAVLKPGDQLLMVDSTYEPTRAFCANVLDHLGIETVYYDPMIGTGIEALIQPNTKAIFMESPGSLTFEVQDVPGICAVAKERGVTTLIDNTWATPLLFPAIAAGVDISICACTKYIGGHSDVMLGSVTVTEKHKRALEKMSRGFGQYVSPDDAFLATRGLRTLGVRMQRHEENALAVARWLKERPEVARVLHPAFEDCPGHEFWQRDFKGASGLFSIVMAGGDDAAACRMIDGLHHFGIGYSWGGYESLALPVDPNRIRSATRPSWEGPLIRLHIGLEDPQDLIRDLEQGLARYRAG